MFLGTHSQSLDEKGRLILPAEWRRQVAEGLVLTRGVEKCLFAFSRSKFKSLTREWELLHLEREDVRKWMRHLYSQAIEMELDKSGRIAIPQTLIEFAQIGMEIVLVGVVNRIEIWNRRDYQTLETKTIAEISGVSERVSEWIQK